MKRNIVDKEGKLLYQEFTCKAIIDPSLKKSLKSFLASRTGKKKYGATEISTFPMAPLKKASAKTSKKK